MIDLLPAPEPRDSAERCVLADVAKYGLHVVPVPPAAGIPCWSFSLGLYRSYGSPEVVVFGLPQRVAHEVLNELGARAASAPLLADELHDGVIEGFGCVLRPVLPKWYAPFLGMAGWYYQRRAFPALQCLWPDARGRYPWDSEFSPELRPAQPLLHLESPREANAEELLRSVGGGPAS